MPMRITHHPNPGSRLVSVFGRAQPDRARDLIVEIVDEEIKV